MKPIETMLSEVEWKATEGREQQPDPDMPYATHEGVLSLPGLGELRVYRLNTGEAIVNAEDLERAFGGFLK